MSSRWIAASLLVLSGTTLANPAFEGRWMIELQTTGAPLQGLLEIEAHDGEWKAWVEGGPAPVELSDDTVTVDVDSRDIRGFIFVRRLEGRLEDGRLVGDYTVISDSDVDKTPGSWVGVPYQPAERPSTPSPVDISGIWTPAQGVDFRKYSMDLTPAAEAWHDDYLMHYDQPNVRCVSPGIVAMIAWGGYPSEILQSDDRITFLYEVESEVRRVFLDDTQPPEYYPHNPMGHSNGRWEGNQLVIETTHLSANVRDFRGEPVSENARMHEVYTLSEDGQRLEAVITLHDPDNYERPPVRRRAWVKNPETFIYPYECDPDSFYRQMYNEDKLDMYFERSKQRY